MIRRYRSLDDLWCEWGDATTAIMEHIQLSEPLDSKYQWIFSDAAVVIQHADAYAVTVIHTALDSTINRKILLSVQARVSESDGRIKVSTLRRSVMP
ncbi:hypothetical protein Metme_4102 [Methylomonas methanica MC09]|uniref:Uncharacterized protein n=2 Tax=Methylomonas methanica TaxID=421 RepID=G0A0E9_METMM|nr:hypothetical protein Metme_4102 [Methylomonas methanica MC09]